MRTETCGLLLQKSAIESVGSVVGKEVASAGGSWDLLLTDVRHSAILCDLAGQTTSRTVWEW